MPSGQSPEGIFIWQRCELVRKSLQMEMPGSAQRNEGFGYRALTEIIGGICEMPEVISSRAQIKQRPRRKSGFLRFGTWRTRSPKWKNAKTSAPQAQGLCLICSRPSRDRRRQSHPANKCIDNQFITRNFLLIYFFLHTQVLRLHWNFLSLIITYIF